MSQNRHGVAFVKAYRKNVIMEIKVLNISDYEKVFDFYNAQIEALERKEFFYPYVNSDLKNLLDFGGIMLGAFDDGKLIGLSAIDYDQTYSGILKRLVNSYYFHVEDDIPVFEYSGVMTDKNYRKLGIASMLYQSLLKIAKKNICLCAVVQLENQASLTFFFKRDFRLVCVKKDFGIDFGYLIKFTDRKMQVLESSSQYINCLDYSAYDKLLKQGFVGIEFEDNKVKMCKIK